MKIVFLCKERSSDGNYSSTITQVHGVLENLGHEVFYEDYDNYSVDEFYELIESNRPDFIFYENYGQAIHTEFMRFKQYSKIFVTYFEKNYNLSDIIIPITDGRIDNLTELKLVMEN